MKAEDLKCGNLVWIKPDHLPIKVAAVHHKKVAYHKYSYKLTWVREGMLEPIPLTEEILEKNLFHKDWDKNWYFESDTDVTINTDKYARIFNLLVRLDYVHELQQLLSLCNINKELKL